MTPGLSLRVGDLRLTSLGPSQGTDTFEVWEGTANVAVLTLERLSPGHQALLDYRFLCNCTGRSTRLQIVRAVVTHAFTALQLARLELHCHFIDVEPDDMSERIAIAHGLGFRFQSRAINAGLAPGGRCYDVETMYLLSPAIPAGQPLPLAGR
jgi:RimJ/RimL family protein N-acetyltransferase